MYLSVSYDVGVASYNDRYRANSTCQIRFCSVCMCVCMYTCVHFTLNLLYHMILDGVYYNIIIIIIIIINMFSMLLKIVEIAIYCTSYLKVFL